MMHLEFRILEAIGRNRVEDYERWVTAGIFDAGFLVGAIAGIEILVGEVEARGEKLLDVCASLPRESKSLCRDIYNPEQYQAGYVEQLGIEPIVARWVILQQRVFIHEDFRESGADALNAFCDFYDFQSLIFARRYVLDQFSDGELAELGFRKVPNTELPEAGSSTIAICRENYREIPRREARIFPPARHASREHDAWARQMLKQAGFDL